MQHRNAFWGRQSLKERVKWCIANERNTGSEYERPWLQQPYSLLFYCHSVSQSLLGWPTFNVKTVPTSSHLFISPSLRETCYPSVSLTWGSLHAALVCFPNFPRAQLESWFNGLHSRDDRRLGVPDRRLCSLQSCDWEGKEKMNNDIFVCCGWQLHAVHNERRRERSMKRMGINLVSKVHGKVFTSLLPSPCPNIPGMSVSILSWCYIWRRGPCGGDPELPSMHLHLYSVMNWYSMLWNRGWLCNYLEEKWELNIHQRDKNFLYYD